MKVTEWYLKLKDGVAPGLSKISGQADALSSKFDKVQRNISGTNSVLGGLKSAALGALGAFAVGNFLDESLKKYDEAAQAQAQLAATYKSTGGIVGRSMDDLQKKSEALAAVTTFDDDDVTKMQSVLLTFTGIKGKIYDQAIPAIADLATKMGTDLNGTALQVGKALNDPIQGINALKRAGVSFSESQQAQIKKLVQTGHLQEAQMIMLTELNKEFGGSAEAAALAGLGPLKQLRNQIGNLMEKVGEFLADGIRWLILNGGLVIDVLKGAAVAAGILAVAWVALNIQTIITTAGMWLLNIAMLANPISILVVAIAALVAAFVVLWNRSEKVRGTLVGLWEAAKQVFKNIAEAASNYLGGLGELLIGIFTLDVTKIKSGLSKVYDGIKGATADIGKGVGEKFQLGYEDGAKKVREKLAGENKKKLSGVGTGDFNGNPDAFKAMVYGGDTTAKGSKATEKGIDNISGGGKSVRNVNVTTNITQNINAADHAQGAKAAAKLYMEEFIRAVNGAEVAIS